MLREVTLERFKNFQRATVSLGKFTLLIGTNASGKSNIREAFRFLHGLSRGYSLSEIIGQKWIEGGVLQWTGIRGGIKEAAFRKGPNFAIAVSFDVRHNGKLKRASYRIEVDVPVDGQAPRVVNERYEIAGEGQFIFDSNPETYAPSQMDALHIAVRFRKASKEGYVGPQINFTNSRPVLSQIADHPEVKPKTKEYARLAIAAFASLRFLDLQPAAMRNPSLPGLTILGDQGENLSSVIQAICKDEKKKAALVSWVRELTPLDAIDFNFLQDATGRVLLSLVEANGQETSAYSASDGTLRFLAMIAALLGPEPARFYFFEELENGIHPTRLQLLLQMISQRVEDGSIQVVASSHSPDLLGYLSKEQIKDAQLVYRLAGMDHASVVPVASLPRAIDVIQKQTAARLLATGWFEDMVSFEQTKDEKELQ